MQDFAVILSARMNQGSRALAKVALAMMIAKETSIQTSHTIADQTASVVEQMPHARPEMEPQRGIRGFAFQVSIIHPRTYNVCGPDAIHACLWQDSVVPDIALVPPIPAQHPTLD